MGILRLVAKEQLQVYSVTSNFEPVEISKLRTSLECRGGGEGLVWTCMARKRVHAQAAAHDTARKRLLGPAYQKGQCSRAIEGGHRGCNQDEGASASRRSRRCGDGGNTRTHESAPFTQWQWLLDGRVRCGLEQERAFGRHGFVLFPRLLSQPGVAHLRQRVDDIYEQKAASVDGEWITNLHQVLAEDDNWMWGLATHPVIIRMVESSLGPGVQLYASQLHRKEPAADGRGGGHVVPAHQDGDGNVRTVWITLDAVDKSNGALEVLPGGHRLGRLPLRHVRSLDELEAAQYFARNNVYQIDLSQAPRQRAFYTYRLPAGGAAMHHSLTPHRSTANTSQRDRRVIILRFMSAGDVDPPGCALHYAGAWSCSSATYSHARVCVSASCGRASFAHHSPRVASLPTTRLESC
jgi:hypothetical protein